MTQDQIDEAAAVALVRLYRKTSAEIARLEEQRKALADRFRALVPVGYTVEVDGRVASKTAPARSFSLTDALEVARVYGIPVAYVQTPDQGDLKDRLRAAGHLDAAMRPGAGAEIVRLG